jgi:Membrane-associating domain
VVVGIVGSYFPFFGHRDTWPIKRFIFAVVIGGISILLSLLYLLAFRGAFQAWPMDLILAGTWFSAFGVLVNSHHGQSCSMAYRRNSIPYDGYCSRWKATEAFTFLSGLVWLASALAGIYYVKKNRKEQAAAAGDEG